MTSKVEFERLSIPVAGLHLAADAAGPIDGQAILFLHGSGQTRQSWSSALKQAVKRGYRAISLDLRGHGDSDWSPDGQYGLERFTADVREVIQHIGGKPVLVGASLGGLISIPIAGSVPPQAQALVLVDVTPRIEMKGAHEVMAFMDSAPNGFASLEAAADAVSAYLPHRPRPSNTSGLLRNLRLRDGRYYWHWDPAFANMGRDAQAKFDLQGPNPMEEAARKITIPALLIRGGRSNIVSEASAREFLAIVPHAEYIDVAGAHHMVAGDANDAFNNAVFGFIDKTLR